MISNTHRQLMLNGYSAIQYCTGIPFIGYTYTEDAQLLYIKKGTLRMRYGNTDYEIRSNQVVLLKKNICVEYPGTPATDEDQPEYIQFTIKSDLVREFTKLTSLPHVPRREHDPVIVVYGEPGWLPYMISLEPYLLQSGKPEPGLIRLKMLELFFHLSRMDTGILEQLLDLRDHFRTNITATVEENIMNSMSVEQLAALSGRSLSSFRRDFIAIYNMPPSHWIRLKRLEKAKELLLNTTMKITDITYTLGFENIAHFSRLFKSHFGYCPSNYKLKINYISEPITSIYTRKSPSS